MGDNTAGGKLAGGRRDSGRSNNGQPYNGDKRVKPTTATATNIARFGPKAAF
jgi:hypothetical protein